MRTSSWLMPLAKYSSTSDTVIRVPLTHALPLRTPGVQVIKREGELMGGRAIEKGFH